ncbi:tagaturonate reductase [Flagellimonas myxillae]|uniref:tagaturonate reductase n=1 Tax=Flagellimonas myxillae TaxID=2942214 RepID=UPI00201EED96|nr:tagaturonate reductase [Muricauda myxillae]MCL6267098.1 tagaturonate reductase [Muricauda myxillae]
MNDQLNRKTVQANTYPIRILQFGEGNFLRAFADWMVHEMNQKANFEAGVAVVQPIDRGLIDMLNGQDGLYTLYLNGIKNGRAQSKHQVIDCIQKGIDPYANYSEYLEEATNPELRFVFSNTTEAGISYNPDDKFGDAPPSSFPGKLTVFLHHRFLHFKGTPDNKGLIIIPCELIDRNGDNLKKIILQYAQNWNLGADFIAWINKENIFCNTLVDRIVPGYPKAKMDAITKELGYHDNLVVEGEMFHLWVIEGPESVKREFPAQTAGLNVIFTDNMKPYRTRKVRILNGAHTSLVPVGYLFGIDKVRESIEDKTVGRFLKDAIFGEICPTLELPTDELHAFANDVLDRFRNPYLEHALISISLNSISKYKTRVLPSVLGYIQKEQKLPKRLLFSLAALIVFYKGDRNGETIPLNDSQEFLDFFAKQWASNANNLQVLTHEVLSKEDFWGLDLTKYEGLEAEVLYNLQQITTHGMKTALDKFLDSNFNTQENDN